MKFISTPVAMLLSTLLVACGGDSSSSSPQAPVSPPANTDKRNQLLVLNEDVARPELTLYDLDTQTVVNRTPLLHVPSALYSSPQHRYGVLMNRAQDEVVFYDAAVTQPGVLNFKLYGAAPTHYRQFNGQAAIFYDGHATGNAKFDIFTEQEIATQNIASQRLPYAHHGVAEPRGDVVLSTYLPAGETKVRLLKSYGEHGDHYHVEQTLEQECPGLHGAASILRYSAFGCEYGILLVEQKGRQFKETKLPVDVRIGTVIGHDQAKNLVGLASTTNALYVVDAEAQRVTTVQWTAHTALKRLKQLYSATARYFVVLDSLGQLTIFDAQKWTIVKQVSLGIAADQLANTQLVAHGQADEVFVSDAGKQQVLRIDLTTGEIKQRLNLEVAPKLMTWLGG